MMEIITKTAETIGIDSQALLGGIIVSVINGVLLLLTMAGWKTVKLAGRGIKKGYLRVTAETPPPPPAEPLPLSDLAEMIMEQICCTMDPSVSDSVDPKDRDARIKDDVLTVGMIAVNHIGESRKPEEMAVIISNLPTEVMGSTVGTAQDCTKKLTDQERNTVRMAALDCVAACKAARERIWLKKVSLHLRGGDQGRELEEMRPNTPKMNAWAKAKRAKGA